MFGLVGVCYMYLIVLPSLVLLVQLHWSLKVSVCTKVILNSWHNFVRNSHTKSAAEELSVRFNRDHFLFLNMNMNMNMNMICF